MIASWLAFLASKLPMVFLKDFFGFLNKRIDKDIVHLQENTKVVVAQVEADVQIAGLKAKILELDHSHWSTRWIRPSFAYPLAFWWIAVIADSMFHFEWDISALPEPLNTWSGWIVSSFFVMRPVEKVFSPVRGLLRSSVSSINNLRKRNFNK